jgi:hypothetical protein
MILDIEIWKKELKRLRAGLAQACQEDDEFQVEKHLYYVAIVSRKLRENRLAPKKLASLSISISRYQPRSGPIDASNYLDAELHHDLNSPKSDNVPHKRIIDLIIHSSFLDWRLLRGKVSEFLISSDCERTAVGIGVENFMKIIDSIISGEFKATPLPTIGRRS